MVSPPPPAVPREMVTYSRMVLRVADGAARGFARVLQVLRRDAEAGEGIRCCCRAPRVRWPSSTTCEMSLQSSPRTTLAPTVEYGPMRAGCGNLRAGGDDRGGMDCARGAHSVAAPAGRRRGFFAVRLVSAHMMVASQATLPSTVSDALQLDGGGAPVAAR